MYLNIGIIQQLQGNNRKEEPCFSALTEPTFPVLDNIAKSFIIKMQPREVNILRGLLWKLYMEKE
jgi:hypothetical protein